MRPQLFANKPATSVLWCATVLVLLGPAPAVGRADVILGNLGAADGANVQINTSNFEAVSFTMGSQNYSVSDVQIRLQANGNALVNFQLQSDASGQPSGSTLFSFDSESESGGSVSTVTFPAGSPFTLTANTTYWLVGSTSSGNAKWEDSSPLTNPSGSGASFGQYQQSANSGASWSPNPSDAPKFQLNGTPSSAGTPEPSSLVLIGTVACVSAAAGWRRRRTRLRELAVVTSSR